MKKQILLIIAIIIAAAGFAQQSRKYTIQGMMTVDSLRNTPQIIKKVYLTHEVGGKTVVLDSAKVKNKKFTFTGTAPEWVEAYSITGFDNGVVQVFLEPGNIVIAPFDGRYPGGAKVHGTPSNDIYMEYLDLNGQQISRSREAMNKAVKAHPEASKSEKDFLPYQTAVFYSNTLAYKTMAMKFVAKHYMSPVSLYIIRYNLQSLFTPKFVERTLLRPLAPSLQKHPMYKEISNTLKAANLKVGSEGPDFTARTVDGKELSLSSLRGKYVLLDFWASWCAPCRREFPFMKEALKLSEQHDNFVILSYSIDSKKADWTNCIKTNALTHPHWLHASTLSGWESDAAKLYKVEAVPRTVLLNPKGQVVAFDLRGEEMVNKIKNILEGEEVYE